MQIKTITKQGNIGTITEHEVYVEKIDANGVKYQHKQMTISEDMLDKMIAEKQVELQGLLDIKKEINKK